MSIFIQTNLKQILRKTQKTLVGIPVKGNPPWTPVKGNSPWTGLGNLWYFTTKK